MFFNTLSTDRPETHEPQQYHQNLTTMGDQSAEMDQGAHINVSMGGVWEFWVSFQELLLEQHF